MKKIIPTSLLMIYLIINATSSFAHCDTRNGPVVMAATEALRTNNVNLILIWVQPKDEAELKAAFIKTISVRKKDKEAQQLADEYFFETAVRLHRMGEGEAYTGIKNEPVEPYILSAEKALQRKSADSILFELNMILQQGLDSYLLAAGSTQSYNPNDVKTGREYVANYIRFLHYVEGLYIAASTQKIAHNEHEAGMVDSKNENTKLQQSTGAITTTNTFAFLVMASLIVLGIIMVFVLVQNKRFVYQHHRHDLHNGMAQHLAQ